MNVTSCNERETRYWKAWKGKKADLKAKTVLLSTVTDKQLEDLSDCKSTALQIIKRNKLEQVKLRNYGIIEEFFVEFEKAMN